MGKIDLLWIADELSEQEAAVLAGMAEGLGVLDTTRTHIRTADDTVRSTIEEVIHSYDDPKVVVLIGESISKERKEKKKISTLNSTIVQIDSVNCIYAVRPSFIMRNQSMAYLYEEVLNTIQALLNQEMPVYTDYSQNPAMWSYKLDQCANALCAIDLETTSLDPSDGRIISMAVTTPTETFVATATPTNLRLFCEWYSKGPRIIHNAIFDTAWLRRNGAKDAPEVFDTMVMAHLHDETQSVKLSNLIVKYLRARPYWGDTDKSALVGGAHVLRNNSLDTYYTYELYRHFLKFPEDVPLKLVRNSSALAVTLSKMQHDRGLCCDVELGKGMLKEVEEQIATLEAEVNEMFPGLNTRSNKQMVELLKKLGIRSPVKTKEGNVSCNKVALKALALKHPVFEKVLKIRSLGDLISKEIMPVVKSDGFVHTSYSLTRAVTGRLSSSDPNLQNIGRNSPARQLYKSRFPGGKILQADYSQQEFRIIMTQAKCKKAMQTLAEGGDPYRTTTTTLGCTRQEAKALDLGLIYGKSEGGLVAEAGFSREKAKKFYKQWHTLYPEVARYHQSIITSAVRHGYITNLFGRRRRLSNMDDVHERNMAFNFPGQSGGFDIVAHAINRLEKVLTSRGFQCIIVHTIHDSIVLDCPPDEVNLVIPLITDSMTNWPDWPVKLAVEVGVKNHL